MEPKRVNTVVEYYSEVETGHEPLIDSAFDLDIHVRRQVQDSLFGSDCTDINNRHKFFLFVWDNKPHICEETGTYLGQTMRAEYMSHILSRGAHIEMWNDPRNINILSPESHRKWETGKKEKMRIWDKNKEIISRLKSEYANLKPYITISDREPDRLTLKQELAIFLEEYLNPASGTIEELKANQIKQFNKARELLNKLK